MLGKKKSERKAREYSIYNSSDQTFDFKKYLLTVLFLKSIYSKTATGVHFYYKVIENSKLHMDEKGNSRETGNINLFSLMYTN